MFLEKTAAFSSWTTTNPVLEAVGSLLRARDHRVQTARNVRAAIALLEKQEFDLVIADLQISENSNGEGLADGLARRKPLLSQNLIWMCAVTHSRGADGRLARNGCQILQKPFKASELISAVDEFILSKAHTAPRAQS